MKRATLTLLFCFLVIFSCFHVLAQTDTPGVLKFPSSVDSLDSLIRAADNASTTLTSQLAISDTTMFVANTTRFPPSGVVSIGDEQISYTGLTSTSLTGLGHGFAGTAVSHGSRADVKINVIASMHLIHSQAIVALENAVNGVSSPPLAVNRIFVGNSSNVAIAVALSGDASIVSSGALTINQVGGSIASLLHSAELRANAATALNTASTLVLRDGSGNFAAGTITATFSGNGSLVTNLNASNLATGTIGIDRFPTSNSVTGTVGTGGVAANTLVKFSPTGTIVAVTGTEGILGIVTTTATVGSTVTVQVLGQSSCVAEGSITQGDYLIAGTVDPTHCKDSGQTVLSSIPLSTRTVGKSVAAASDGQTFGAALIGPYKFGSQTELTSVTGILGSISGGSGLNNAGTLNWGAGGTLGTAAYTNVGAYEVPLTFGTGLTRTVNTVTVNSSQVISIISNLTTNGFVKVSGGAGTLSVDTTTYLSANQTITLAGDVTGSGATAITTALANIPSATPMAGSLLATNIVAPSTPAAGKTLIYIDSTTKVLTAKNDAGTISNGIIADAGATNNFLTGISAAGVIAKAQPAFSNLSGSVAAGQMPALTGDITTSAGAVATTLATVNSNVGTFTNATVTVNGKGLITAVSTGSGGGATTALDNLAAVSINSALLFQTGIDIGSTVKPARNIFFVGSGTFGTNYFEFTGTPTAARVVTLPDLASYTLAQITGSQTFGGTQNFGAMTSSSTFTDTQSIAATSTDGVIITNTTAAAAGAQQWSPRLRLTGQGWKTTATAASQTTDWIWEVQPVQGTTNPTSKLVLSSQINAGGYVVGATFNSTATTTTQGFLALPAGSASAAALSINTINFFERSSNYLGIDGSGMSSPTFIFEMGSGGRVLLTQLSGVLFANSNSDAFSGTYYGGINGDATGLNITNGTAGKWNYLKVGNNDGGTTTVTNGLIVGHQSTGTPAAGLGSAILFNINSSTTADQNAAQIAALWTTATDASRTADLVFKTVNNAAALAEAGRFTGAGNFSQFGKTTVYNNVATAGYGHPTIYASGRSTAQTAAVASVAAFTVGAADGSFEVSANVLVTTATAHAFTVTVAYTDESNTARTLTLPFSVLAGTFATSITNATGAVPYEGVALHIRCKAATTITVATTGTFTTVTYNVEGIIRQLS